MNGTEPEIGNRYDIIVADTPPKLLRDLEFIGRDDDFFTFHFRDGHAITFGRRYIIKFEPTRVIQNDVARFAARSIGAGIGKLPQGLAQCGDRNAPDIRPAQDCRFFARRKL